MAEVMMALGDYRFSVATAAYQTLERQTEYRWAKQDRMGRAPARQFGGIDDDTISLAGVILPHYRGGLGQLNAMRAQAGAGKPLMLVDGMGKVWGKYCILKVREGQSQFLGNGAPLKIEFTIELAAYGDDQETGP
ncbi:MAG: phage tail protein [Magnetospirillum sp.]|nr:phage tail protein [Magnetospirillum sp.]